MTKLKSLMAMVFATAFAGGVQAATINATDFTEGLNSQVIGGILWTTDPSTEGFQYKSRAGFTGVGISGNRTPGEIDIGQSLNGQVLTQPTFVTSLTLGLLFNGPEFNDVNEVAQVTINLGGAIYTLTAIGDTTAVWTGPGTVTNLSPATEDNAAVWLIDLPFGWVPVTDISLTAIPGVCGGVGGTCTNQSDFVLIQMVTAVPVPGALALFGAALIGLGLVVRRRAA